MNWLLINPLFSVGRMELPLGSCRRDFSGGRGEQLFHIVPGAFRSADGAFVRSYLGTSHRSRSRSGEVVARRHGHEACVWPTRTRSVPRRPWVVSVRLTRFVHRSVVAGACRRQGVRWPVLVGGGPDGHGSVGYPFARRYRFVTRRATIENRPAATEYTASVGGEFERHRARVRGAV